MTKTPYAAIVAVLILVCQSCSKSGSGPQPVHADSLKLSLTYADTSRTPSSSFELIVQEPGGKLLLDTLAPVNIPIAATLRTSDTLVNVTTVYMGIHDTAFTVRSYPGVNPSGWQTFPLDNAFVVIPDIVGASIHKTLVENIPGFASVPVPQKFQFVWFSDGDAPVLVSPSTFFPTAILLYGNFYPENYLYSLIPSLGLYNFHVQGWSGGSDTVDLSHMDTAKQVNFPRPSQYGQCYCILDGIMDTTDRSKSLMLYFSPNTHFNADLEYPTKYVQKYQVHATFSAPDSTQVTYYSYGSTISPNFLFPDPSKYSIGSVQGDNFSIQFNNLSPTFYETQWKSGKINLYIFSKPDSGSQHPQTLLKSLKSQKLQGQTIAVPLPVNLQFETVDGMNYGQLLSYSANPSVYAARRVASVVRLLKTF